MNIRAALLGLFLPLGIVAPVLAQSNGPVGLIVGQTPVIGGTSGQCLSIGSNRALNSVACGSGGSGVSTFSAGTTGFTPSTGSTGNVVLNGILNGANGGTGVANTGKTINLGGNLSFPGSFPVTMTATGSTSVVLPTSGTLATVAGTVGTFSAGSTGLTPNTGTPGNVVLGGTLNGASGGTGVSNTGKTITLGGNLTTSGGFNTTITVTGDTSVTLPTSGTIATTANTVTSFNGGTTGFVPSSATSGVVTLTGTLVGANGGTGVNNSGKTVTLGGNLVTSGAFNTTLTVTADTNVTFPTSGTLATVGGTTSSFSGGTTGLTPGSPAAGAIVLGGVLTGANGGTGVINTGSTITLGGNLTTVGAVTIPSTIATLAANTFTGGQVLNTTLNVAGLSTLQQIDTRVTWSAITGTTTTNIIRATASGNADGTTDLRGISLGNTVTGANNVAGTIAINNQNELQHTTGTVALAIGMDTYVRLGLSTQNPGWAGSATNVYGLRTHIANESALGVIDRAYSLYVQAIDLADPVDPPRGTVNYAHGLHVDQQQGQPGGALLIPGRVVQEAIGVYVSDMNAGAALTAAYYTHMQDNSPDQTTYPKYAFYTDGSAKSIILGGINIGSITDPGTTTLQVSRNLEAGVSGNVYGINQQMGFGGASDATGNFRAFRQQINVGGSNNLVEVDLLSSNLTLNTTGGTTAAVYGLNSTIVVNDAGNVTAIRGVNSGIFLNSAGNVGSAIGVLAQIAYQSGAGTVGTVTGVSIPDLGGSRVTSSAVGIDVAAISTITGGGLNAGIRVSNTLGTNRWSILSSGNANGAHLGNFAVGKVTAPTVALDVVGLTAQTNNFGAAAAGLNSINNYSNSFSGDAGGTTDMRVSYSQLALSGTANVANVNGVNTQLLLSHTAGTVAIATSVVGLVQNNNNGAITLLRGGDFQGALATGTGVVGTATGVYARVRLASGTGTATLSQAFFAGDSGGSFATTAIGFDSEAMSVAGTLTANFRAQNSASSTRWAFLSTGTANSALAAGLRLGSNVTPVATLDVTGNFAQSIAYGAAPAGTTTSNSFGATLSGDVGGTTDMRLLSTLATLSGANSVASLIGNINTVTLSHTAGTVTTAKGMYIVLGNTNNGAVTNMRGVESNLQLSSGTGVVATAIGVYAKVARASGTGTATLAQAFFAADSGGAYATTAIGFDTESMSAAGTLTANFRAVNSNATTRWAYLSTGTANSSFAGGLRLGSNVQPVATLDVTGSIAASTTVAAGTTFQSAAPAGATAGLWKLGSLVTASVVVDLTRSVFVDIGGTVYKLIVAQ